MNKQKPISFSNSRPERPAAFTGIRARIVLVLAVVLAAFIVLTEFTVSSIIRISLNDHVAETPTTAGDNDLRTHPPLKINAIRRPVLLYLTTGAIIALILASLAINYVVVRPLSRMNDAVQKFGRLGRQVTVPATGTGETIQLAHSINDMIGTIQRQEQDLKDRLSELETNMLELTETRGELVRSAKLALVGTMASGVAHEIGNPVAGVMGLLDAMDAESDKDTRQEYLRLAQKEVERIDKTIRDLLAYARPAGKSNTRVPLRDVISHVQDLMSAQKKFSQIDLVFKTEQSGDVSVPGEALEAVLVNLLFNGANAIDGPGKIEIVTRLADGPPSKLELAVTDNGPGIPDDTSKLIFEPFFSKSTTGDGNGLGLSICQSICEAEGGSIILDDTFNDGARFVVTLPV